jgi:hypothetical protein
MERETEPGEHLGVSVVRRLGSSPLQRGSTNDYNCPDLFVLSDGRIGCIGTDLTETLRHRLPVGASIGPSERLVGIPPQAVRDALPELVEQLRPGARLFRA